MVAAALLLNDMLPAVCVNVAVKFELLANITLPLVNVNVPLRDKLAGIVTASAVDVTVANCKIGPTLENVGVPLNVKVPEEATLEFIKFRLDELTVIAAMV